MAGTSRTRLREHWDRALFYAAVSGYGLFSLIRPTGSMTFASQWVATPTYVAFVVAGALLAAGWFSDRAGVYLAGNAVGVAAMGSVAVTVVAVNIAPGSLLVVALGLALLIMLRRNRRDNRDLRTIADLSRNWRAALGDE